jgi:ArsR family transcriptional regulator
VRVSRPLYQAKAEFFKTLGHPARIRVLELLSQREHAVGELLPEVGVEATSLSQQLAVLRRAGLVTSRKEGSTVYYALTSPQVAELLAVARRILTEVLAGQVELLADLQAASPARPAAPPS